MTGVLFITAQYRQRFGLFLETCCDAARILKIAHQIEHLHPVKLLLAFESREPRLQMIEIEAVVLHRNASALQTMALGDPEKYEVTRVFHQHDVARIAEAFRK